MGGSGISILSLVFSASWVVKFVMLLLLAASVCSWGLILKKIKLLKSAKLTSSTFTKKFWSGADPAQLFRSLPTETEGSATLFQAGFKAFSKMQDSNAEPAVVIETIERALRVGFSREAARLEDNLTVLATIGSVSPYVGLFGTVWGIMSAFIALGGVQQATLSMVAPGIAEALIATAMGLFAAIPAVIAYNRFLSLIEVELNEYENFSDEFVNLLSRQLGSARRS
ncbi:MAG: protein TolQ [Gammaproteobacteria bacterium]|nr:protein TolQ [Gammaproteobacteria bacterium]